MKKNHLLLLASLLAIKVTGQGPDTYPEVSLPELMKKKAAGESNMVILDVRSRGEFGDSSRGKSGNIGRIRGAINFTLQDLQGKPETVKQLDKFRDNEIYLICSHSYRSRSASNILLKNGFTHVNNVRGGMTEWYRRYDELKDYRSQLDDADITYTNYAPAQLLSDLQQGKNLLLLGISSNPRFWWDSANQKYSRYFPALKNTRYFSSTDSAGILAEVKKDPSRRVVLFNLVNSGSGELAEWLKQKDIAEVNYLVGGLSLFYEYVSDKQPPVSTDAFFEPQTTIRFLTPQGLCAMSGTKNYQVVDIRHDSLFNKVNEGVKHDYKHLAKAVNFPSAKGTDAFEKEFPDRKKQYVFINSFSSEGIELADALSKKGYKISWLNGGYDRWEWFMNNLEGFPCQDMLEK